MENKEGELIMRSQKGDIEAFEELISLHQQQVFTMAYRFMGNYEDASDLAQEALLRAYKSIDKFRLDASFKTWIYRIVANVCCDEIRRRQRRAEVSLNEPIITEKGEIRREQGDNSRSPENIYLQKEQAEYLQQLISSLAPEYRITLVMRDIQGFSYQEIAEKLGCSLGTVKSRLSRARRVLRDRIVGREEHLGSNSSQIKK